MINQSLSPASEQFQNCHEEPIHIIGHIQSIGYLLVLDRTNLEIVQASNNIDQLTGEQAGNMLGQTIDCFFSYSFLEKLNEVVQKANVNETRPFGFHYNATGYLVNIHDSEGYLVLEFEKDNERERSETYLHYSSLVENILTDMEHYSEVPNICQGVINKLGEITGFNRMMVYRFDEEGHGEVIAEKKEEDMIGYLGLKFPESDIPRQARELYLKNALRGISNVEDEPVAIHPAIRKQDGKPLDLSHSILRSVSPIHVAYLKNMGVYASFSISIIVKGKLWGLILCHHTQKPVKLNIYQRRACLFIGKMLSQKIEITTENALADSFHLRMATLQRVVTDFVTQGDIHEAFKKYDTLITGSFKGCGYILNYNGKISHSNTLRTEWVDNLMAQLKIVDESIIHSHNLIKDFPQLMQLPDDPAGMLAIKTSKHLNEGLIIVREERQREVHWAGRPEASKAMQGGGLNPRNSFEKWVELVKAQSKPWSEGDLLFAEEFRRQLTENIIAVSQHNQSDHLLERHNLRLRMMERTMELEETNRLLQEELNDLRKREAQQRLAHTIAEEKNRLHSLKSVK